LSGVCASREVADLDTLPFPRWDLLAKASHLPGVGVRGVMRPLHGGCPIAQFKILTPSGNAALETTRVARLRAGLQRFDGFTPTFTHPALSAGELRFLLGAAYSRFYLRPSFLANYLGWALPGCRTSSARWIAACRGSTLVPRSRRCRGR
jgi:hypothetical protein